MTPGVLKEGYVSKMLKVDDKDRWSLISLGNNRCKAIDLKFVNNMRRHYEFSIDSFHIILDPLLSFYDCKVGASIIIANSQTPQSISFVDNPYPTVVCESIYGDFNEAIFHLQGKLIANWNQEEIRAVVF